MTAFWSKLTFLGIIFFAVTLFLPWGSPHSPSAYFQWSYDAVFMSESPGESLAFLGICLALAYPYLWASITAIFLIGSFQDRWGARSQFIVHLVGAVPITALGLTLIFLKAEFPPARVQWIAVLTPGAFIISLLAAAKLVKSPRRFSVLVALALLLFIPLQFILYYYVQLDGGAGWGYLMGGIGALVGLIGSSVLFFLPRLIGGGRKDKSLQAWN